MGISNQGTDTAYIIKVDDATSTITYVGEAEAGSATSGAYWRIKRLTTLSTVLTIQYADGDALYNNIWDNRASLTYS